jgi:hypothetical protein
LANRKRGETRVTRREGVAATGNVRGVGGNSICPREGEHKTFRMQTNLLSSIPGKISKRKILFIRL